jgi:hypothetical protein
MVNLPGAFSFIVGPRRQKGHLPSIRATIKLTQYSGHAILGVRRRPPPVAASLAALAGALVPVVSPVATTLGFLPVPSGLTLMIVAIIVAYLASAEVAKYIADRRVGGAEKSLH